jgi:membrane protein implicated in regulation of membrane protease activity
MPSGAGGILLALLSFIVTFTLARVLSRRWRQERERKAREAALHGESRQARRRRERKKRG